MSGFWFVSRRFRTIAKGEREEVEEVEYFDAASKV
jgi:hypothetical protein